ncbi:MAG: hypothetical protein IJ435_03765 [Clostridia bacterium]|nr:hypothetical protein [Clostridia bacterium]
MREFKFNNRNVIEFLFEGEVFSAPFAKASTAMGEIGPLLSQAVKNREVLDTNVTKTLEMLDELFGKGSIKKIFEGREIDALDVCDLVMFISDEVVAFGEKKEAEAKKAIADAEKRKFLSNS